ncbi:MAG: heme ABC exporter ATP-binding protein CcmA [Marinicella sp.]|nr:heme ABC exporter ATP-binding protein CcmA [Xanthomonadales bacterium]
MTSAQLQIQSAQCQRAGELLFAPVSWTMDAGQLAVIAGPNGSGKTTLLQALSGLSLLASGSRIYQGSSELSLWLKESHYLGHKLGNKGNLSCFENLQFVAQVNETSVTSSAISAVLEKAGLAGYEYQHANDLSAGQKKRLALSRLLLLNKIYWLLDEPFVNLDYAGCDWLYEIIEKHISQGGSVILTAHDQKKIHELAHHHITLEFPEEVHES